MCDFRCTALLERHGLVALGPTLTRKWNDASNAPSTAFDPVLHHLLVKVAGPRDTKKKTYDM